MIIPTTNDHKQRPTHKPYLYSNWCYLDSLDGEEFKDGEKVVVTWQDGVKDHYTIRVKGRTETVDDMGHPWNIPIREAYIEVLHHGAKAQLRLLDAEGILSVERA